MLEATTFLLISGNKSTTQRKTKNGRLLTIFERVYESQLW